MPGIMPVHKREIPTTVVLGETGQTVETLTAFDACCHHASPPDAEVQRAGSVKLVKETRRVSQALRRATDSEEGSQWLQCLEGAIRSSM